MNPAAEFTAAFPEPHVILGLRLLPLSLGRYRLLKRFNSPFVDDDTKAISLPAMCKELFFALVICGLPCREFRELVTAGKLVKECKRFGKTIGRVIARENGFNIMAKHAQFKRYLDDGTALPWKPLARAGGIDTQTVSHWSHAMEVNLRARVGWTADEVDEEPMTKAMCDFFQFMQSEGAVDLVSHEDFSEIETHAGNNADLLLAFEQQMMKGTN